MVVIDPDVPVLVQRLHRIARAVEVGCHVAVKGDRPLVSAALTETVWEAVGLGHQLTQVLAYDDLWSQLPGLISSWRAIEDAALQVQFIDPQVVTAADIAGDLRRALQRVDDAATAIDAAQAEMGGPAGHPGSEARGRLHSALADLETAADTNFVTALAEDQQGRLDAAMALLTACAARISRERTASGWSGC